MKFSFRFLRRVRDNRRAAVIAALLAVLAVAVGLYVRSYHDAGPTAPIGAPSPGGSGFPTLGTVSPGASVSPTSSFFPSKGSVVTLPQTTITGIDGGGLHFAPGSQHTVVMTARSAGSVIRVGYIVPTSTTDNYGNVKVSGDSWSVTTVAYGKPAYALVFIQAGAAGVPITCTITVDGHVSNTATTKGTYGRQVCLG